MIEGLLGENIGVREDVIQRACKLSMKAHERSSSPSKPYIHDRTRLSNDVFFAFPGSWRVEDWYAGDPFGEVGVDESVFPSMRSVGSEDVGLVNEAFCRRFHGLLHRSSLAAEVLNFPRFLSFCLNFES